MGNRTEIHDKVLNAKSLEDISEVYGIWAKSYDQDLLTELGDTDWPQGLRQMPLVRLQEYNLI